MSLLFAGLLCRKFQNLFPDDINLYLGDTIWAMMVYYFFRGFFFKHVIIQHALYCSLYCYITEISQLYHAPWIDSIRNTTIGGLVLGFGFLWSDIVAYTLGISLSILLEFLLSKFGKRMK
ncbi:MAG: DUF2809 domain-containing protein [Bacteroidia bacterium]